MTLKDLTPEVHEALVRRAHRERAEALHRLLVVPLKRLLQRRAASTRATPRVTTARA